MDEPGPSSRPDAAEDDDPVVREIPIIHSKKLEDMLYLFQFPFKKKDCTNETKITKCLFKPENKEVMLEMSINTESPNFDTGRAELIAHEIDGDINSKKNKDVYFENEIVDKVFLKSSRSVKEGQNYAVAAYNGREIHLTSIKDVFQLRPHFPYLDKGLKKKKDLLNNVDSEDEEVTPSNAQQVTVKFKQAQDPDKKGIHEITYHALQARRNQEPWTECKWHDESSTVSNVEKLKLISDNTFETGQAQNLSKEEYMKLLVPEDQEQTPLEPTLPSHVLSLHALRGLPLQEQCRLLLKDVQIIQFQQIMLLLASVEGVTADSLLKTLQKVAVLVRGNWVVKSEVLYPDNSFSATSGVPAELMCRARDYILYLFTKQQYVERKKVSSLLKIPAEEVKEIFAGISKLRTHNKGWELSLSTDHDFLAKHADLAQRQNLFWEHRYHQLSLFLNQPSTQRRKSKSASESDGGSKARTSSVSCSDNESGTESKGKSPVLPRKKMRQDSCGSVTPITNTAPPDSVAATTTGDEMRPAMWGGLSFEKGPHVPLKILLEGDKKYEFGVSEYVMDRPTVPGQTGYLTLNSDGAVLASGGDLDNDEKTAGILQGLLGLANDRLDPKAFDQGFKRLTVTYDEHAYVVCLSNRKIHIIKRQIEAGE